MTKTAKDEKVSSARRRLIKGGLAAPAVVALHSGSALAAVSNRNCINNQLNAPQFPSSPADGFVRVQLWTLAKKDPTADDKPRYFISGDDVQMLTMNSSQVGNTFLYPGEWMEFDPLIPATVFPKLPQSPQTDPLGETLVRNGAWVAVRVNGAMSGNISIVGVVGPGSTGTAVAGTCWSSFVGYRAG